MGEMKLLILDIEKKIDEKHDSLKIVQKFENIMRDF